MSCNWCTSAERCFSLSRGTEPYHRLYLFLSYFSLLQLVEEEQELRHRLHLQNLYLEARRLGSQVQEEIGSGEGAAMMAEKGEGHDANAALTASKIETGI